MAMDAQRQEEIAARIKDLRGRTPQRVIADRVGVTERAYQAWEAGGGISWDNLVLLAEALGVSEEYLVYGDAGDEARSSTQFERVAERLDRIETKLDALTAAVVRLAPAGAQEPLVAEALRDADEVERQLDAGELPSAESAVATGNRRAAAARRR